MKQKLIELLSCNEAIQWVGDKTWEQAYSECHRGDWLLWLFKKTNPHDLRLLTLAKGHCANTLRHQMKDQRSRNAVDAAISFGMGLISKAHLDIAAKYAADAYTSSPPATYAASSAADAYAAAFDNAHTPAKFSDQKTTLDIVKKYLPIEEFNL